MSVVSGSGLVKAFEPGARAAVDRVDLSVGDGETLALVGASGSGKSTVGQMLAGLTSPTAGVVRWHGEAIADMSASALRRARRDVQVVFQRPRASLDPRWTAGATVRQALRHAGGLSRREAESACAQLFDQVGLDVELTDRHPAELSGGQAQRVAIARALAANPQFLVLDEPFSALDSIHTARLVDLLLRLQAERGLAYLFITHDFGLVGHLADRVAVLDAGRLVETGAAARVLREPSRPETNALIEAVPGRTVAHPG